MLESLKPDAPLNIRDISTEAPEQKSRVHFDPKRDLSEEDWGNMVRELGTYMHDVEAHLFCTEINALHDIDSSLNIEITESEWQSMTEDFVRIKEDSEITMQSLDLIDYGELFKFYGKRELALDEYDYKKALTALDELSRERAWFRFTNRAARVHKLDPTIELKISAPEWASVANALEEYRQNDWWRFVIMASSLKTMGSPVKVEISEEEWLDIMQILWVTKNGKNWRKFTSMARALTILCNDESEGEADFALKQEPLPQVRKF